MASAISLEYLQSLEGQANGLATLDGTGKLPLSQIPDNVIPKYKGEYPSEAALSTAFPSSLRMDFAYIADTSSYWYWNPELTTPAWVNENITAAAYTALSTEAKAAVPYTIIP